jgi:hypothetical protein
LDPLPVVVEDEDEDEEDELLSFDDDELSFFGDEEDEPLDAPLSAEEVALRLSVR